jgi:DNA repair protein RadA/Sms
LGIDNSNLQFSIHNLQCFLVARDKTSYICQQCSYESTRWLGKCPSCGEWNSLVETIVSSKVKSQRSKVKSEGKKPVTLSSVKASSTKRVSTKISELDRVLGGGIVPGQVILIAGEPGIGKSTLLLQVANQLSAVGSQPSVLYVSGEESVSQISIRAQRLGVGKPAKGRKIQVMEETNVDSIVATVDSSNVKTQNSKVLIIDSIQTMVTTDLSGMAGSVGQVRECTYRLIRLAKANNIPIFIAGHVTKEGTVAGPAVLAHLVDTVLWFEGEKNITLRLLRAVKNRFGPTDEVGVFSMENKGLIPQSNPEKVFLTRSRKSIAGNVVSSVLSGTRPILIEIQSLVVPTKMAFPKRIAQGIDSKRFELLLAVLQRRCGLPLYKFDCFANVAGGIAVKNDPSVDLAVCLSVASAFYDKPFTKNAIAIGEVGLLGDIREVPMQDRRLKEARRLGFRTQITNKTSKYLQQTIEEYLK